MRLSVHLVKPSLKKCKNSQQKLENSTITNKKLTMGLNSYKQIKQAHLKKHICEDYIRQISDNKECTFHPHLDSESKQNPRSLKKFLQDQQKFTMDKKQKIQLLRNQITKSIDQQYKSKPSIDTNSHRISTHLRNTNLSTNNDNNVFERLSKQINKIHEVYEQEEIFSPKICIKSRELKRDKDVSSLLYDDALRRQQKQQLNIQQFLKKQFLPNINTNTNNLVIKKIYNEFISYIRANVNSQVSQLSPLLSINILSDLFNVDLNPNRSQQQQKICQKVLFFIADTKTQMVNMEILWNFIQTIISGHLVNSNFTQQEENQIYQTFGYFYKKRLTKHKKTITPQKCNFQPKTLRSSEKLAQNHRQKTLQSVNQYLESQKVNIQLMNNGVKIQDLFIIQHLKKNAQNQRKRIQKYNAELQNCSFKPDLNLSKRFNSQHNQTQKKRITLIVPKTTKTQQLQKNYKIKQKNDQVENKQNVQNIKTAYQTSQRPKKINSTTIRSKKKYQKTEKPQVKSIQKNIMRMTLARKNKQFKNALNQRGYPPNVDNWQNFRKSLKTQIEKSGQRVLKVFNSLQKQNLTQKSQILMHKNLV